MITRQSDGPEVSGLTLGAFLRTRREQLTPAKAGIRASSRRRTPGLRREEVAALSAISPEWYTYLEQDRDIRPSHEVIDRIAAALQLTAAERRYLRTLAFPKVDATPSKSLPTALQGFIDDLEYRPAYVVNDFWDIVGWNGAAAALFPGLRAEAQPNLVTSVFRNDEWRNLYRNWERNARKMLALFRLTVATHAGHRRCAELIALLAGSREFSAWWQQQDVSAATAGTKQMVHPRGGELSLEYTSFRTSDDPALTAILFRPSDAASRSALIQLSAPFDQNSKTGQD